MIFLIFIALLWLFAVFPGKRRVPFSKYAHRGLHGQGVLENTTEAFSLAREQGFGAELDVRLTADGVPVVFHDKDLNRIFQKNERVDALSLSELKSLTEDLVPTLEEALEALGGAPLLCEIKAGERVYDTLVCERTAAVLDRYGGAVCVESFDPFLLRWFKRNRPNIPRGLLTAKHLSGGIFSIPLKLLFFNFLARPNFFAVEKCGYAYFSFFKALFKPSVALWTVTDTEEPLADSLIFERK